MSHTPGPWFSSRMRLGEEDKDRRCGFVVNGPDKDPLPTRICDLRVPSGVSGFSEGEANARLIAAAPELLEALKFCLTQLKLMLDDNNRQRKGSKALSYYIGDNDTLKKHDQEYAMSLARAVISKAEGECQDVKS